MKLAKKSSLPMSLRNSQRSLAAEPEHDDEHAGMRAVLLGQQQEQTTKASATSHHAKKERSDNKPRVCSLECQTLH
jgi:hypothetical protein